MITLRTRLALLLFPLCCLLAGCDRGDSLDRILDSGELVVVSRNSPTTFYLDKAGPTGFEFTLATLLARELGVTLTMESAFSLQGIFERLTRQEADIAAAGLTLTGDRELLFPHSAHYYLQRPQVVYVAGSRRPREMRDLLNMKLVVLAGSSHAQSLQALRGSGFPGLQWEEIEAADSMELLELVEGGAAELAIIDSHEFEVQQSLYPRLKVAFDLGAEQEMVWYFPPGIDNQRLITRIDGFFLRLRDEGTLTRLRDEYFGHRKAVSRVGSHTFNRKMRRALPDYRVLIEQVAAEYQMEWHLLAAIAYQESHWNPRAKSPTGVRGMMMLTLPTAGEMGVTNRLDPVQSLRGGARYFKNMKLRLPASIAEPDRTWMALAAYNIGLGHLRDARRITRSQGGDPNLWSDVMERLPLLQKSTYYRDTRHGYARGMEAVSYVQNIRHYDSILQWQDLPNRQPLPPLAIEEHVPAAVRSAGLQAL